MITNKYNHHRMEEPEQEVLNEMFVSCMQTRISTLCKKIRNVLAANGLDPAKIDDIIANISDPDVLEKHKIISPDKN